MPPNTGQKSRKPAENAFKQQRLPAWQPTMSPKWVVPLFILIAIIFIPIGSVIVWLSTTIVESEIRYDELCEMTVPTGSTSGAKICTINRASIVIPNYMKQPIYMYYELDGFYQNHRRYSQSRSDNQLAGGLPSWNSIKDCQPLRWPGDLAGASLTGSNDAEKNAKIYNPCGLIAWSMFNDTFVLYDTDNITVICNGPTPDGTGCTKRGIAWPSDREKKYVLPPQRVNLMYPETYANESSHQIPEVTDEDFMVWMRTAALPNFRKLHRIIKTDLPAGTYYFDIVQNYPVKTFNGKKKVILSTTSWIGGQNLFMGIAYLVVGAVCACLGFVFIIGAIIKNRRNAFRKH